MKIGSTKREIIKALDERNKTVSELSKELGLAKSSIYKHLVTLNSKGIVERITNGNRFVYYRLTGKGKEILDLVLSLIISSISSIIAYMYVHPQHFQVKEAKYLGGSPLPLPQPTPILIEHSAHPTYTTTPNPMAAILAFIFVFIITFLSFRLYRVYRIEKKN